MVSSCLADRAAQPAYMLGKEFHPFPLPLGLSWQPTPLQARLVGPVPVAGATGRPADRPVRPVPYATAPLLLSSPSAPAPADPPSANDRPPAPPALLLGSAAPTAPVAP